MFGLSVLGSVAWICHDVWSAFRYIEPKPIRRRVHKVLEDVARTIFPRDKSLQITIFLPDSADGTPVLVPIVRYHRACPDEYRVSSKVRFRPDSTKLVRQAWDDPGENYGQNIPATTFKSLESARSWYVHHMEMPTATALKLSEWTLSKVQCVMVVALHVPFLPKQPIGIASFSSEQVDAFKFEDDQDKRRKLALGAMLQVVSVMLAPLRS